ncbi:protein lin-52 homolog isoform X1 [Sarcophilus harrisii]|uniref:Protein lin-52 homolog n=1 Tax=Sarcophilus harrisii TaxID=9305 RepID=A0A7N4NGS8_SARHA|nr:protein lin-52 homolog isoform X1 [Sarcophilus harrisii]
MGRKMASPTDGTDLEASLLSFEKLDRASPDLWPEQLPGVAEFAASFKSPITSSPPKWMAELEHDDIDMLKADCCQRTNMAKLEEAATRQLYIRRDNSSILSTKCDHLSGKEITIPTK